MSDLVLNPITGKLDEISSPADIQAVGDALYLPLAGGTLTGKLTLKSSAYGICFDNLGTLSNAANEYIHGAYDGQYNKAKLIIKTQNADLTTGTIQLVGNTQIMGTLYLGSADYGVTSLVKLDGSKNVVAATDGTDYLSPTTGLKLDQTIQQYTVGEFAFPSVRAGLMTVGDSYYINYIQLEGGQGVNTYIRSTAPILVDQPLTITAAGSTIALTAKNGSVTVEISNGASGLGIYTNYGIDGYGYRISGHAVLGTILRGNGTDYTASAVTYPDAISTGQLLYASYANTLAATTDLTYSSGALSFGGATRAITTAAASAVALQINPGTSVQAPGVPGPALTLAGGAGNGTGTPHSGGPATLTGGAATNGGTGGAAGLFGGASNGGASGGAVNIAGGAKGGSGTNDGIINLAYTGSLARGTVKAWANITFADAVNLIFDATTGTQIATAATQKLAFWGSAPIVRPTTAIAGAAFVQSAGTAVNNASTFGGYTIAQMAAALQSAGLLA